jgi:hypothetical protein
VALGATAPHTHAMTFGSRVRALFVRSQASPEEIGPRIWTDTVSTADYVDASEKYQAAIMEQYKLYVEMADRISARRSTTNTFFLTLNTAVLALIGLVVRDTGTANHGLIVVALVILSIQCVAWFWLLRSYRQLSSAKFRVIGAMEERLPASPYWRAEWMALGAGRDISRYWPLTHLEQWVPPIFALAYAAAFVLMLTR